MKNGNITAILLALSLVMGTAATGCGDSSNVSQETGVSMNEMQEGTEVTGENEDSGENVSQNHANMLGEDLEQINEEFKQKTDIILENVEKMLEEKKEGN